MVGEVSAVGEAYYLAEELRVQGIAEGRVVELPPELRPLKPRGITGEYLPAFLATIDRSPKTKPKAQKIREKIASETREETAGEKNSKASIQLFLKAWERGEDRNPDIGAGAIVAAETLWERRTAPEETLYIAGRVARGEWQSTAEERLRAQVLVADLLYGHRRDWRAAWQAARALEANTLRTASGQASDKLRQAALLVELADRRVQPAVEFAVIRRLLREAQEIAPETDKKIAARINSVYVQTFAWEGNWLRVEDLATGFLRDYPDELALGAMVRIQLARSYERTRAYAKAASELDTVIGTSIPYDQFPRLGIQTLDPRDYARLEYSRITRIQAGALPVVALEEPVNNAADETLVGPAGEPLNPTPTA